MQDAVDEVATRVPGLGPLLADIPPGLPAVQADPALLEQILVNILENAAKYGGAGAEVHLHARPEGGLVCITVTDGGPGIPPADLPHVFDSFYRSQRGDRTVPGTGLGLAIARGLTEAMGGSIEAASPAPGARPGDSPGTAITLRLRTAP